MKTTTIFLWTLNVLLVCYLGIITSDTAMIRREDVAQIEVGNQLMASLDRLVTFANLNWVEEMEKRVVTEGYRPYDTNFLNLAKNSANKTKALKNKLGELKQVNQENANAITELLANYENEVLLDTAAQRELKGRVAYPIHLFVCANPLLQKTHLIISQSDIERVNSKIVEILGRKTTGCDVSFDKIIAMSVPKQRVVEEGKDYEADLALIDGSFYPYHISASLNGKLIEAAKNWHWYDVTIPATADKFNENGECKKTWKAEITIAKPLKDTTYIIEKEYIIKKKQ